MLKILEDMEDMDLNDEEYNLPQNSPEKVDEGKLMMRGLTIKSTKPSEDKNEHQKARNNS